MPHAKPWVTALLDIALRTAKPADQKVPEALLGAGEVGCRVHRAKNIVRRNLAVERRDQAMKAIFADGCKDFEFTHVIEDVSFPPFPGSY
jgi:hypothetical protein